MRAQILGRREEKVSQIPLRFFITSPSKVFDRRSRAASGGILEGRPPCRPTHAGRSPASFRPTRPRWRAGKMGADRAPPSKHYDGRSRATFVVILEGRPPCRPTHAGRSPASFRPTRPRWRAGKMGADRAPPSKHYDGRSRATFVVILEGRPPCRPTHAGRSPASFRPTRPRWRAGKMGADRAPPSKHYDGRSRATFVVILEGRPPCRPTHAGRSPASFRPTRPRWRAGKMGADRAPPSKHYDGRSRATFVVILEGRPPCRPTHAGRSPASFRPTRPRWRAGKMGADRAPPSKGFETPVPQKLPPIP